MANPATTLARTTQDKRIPELDTLPPGTNPSTLTVPVYNPATDKTHQAPLGGPVPNTNAVPGGAKVVQYRDSRLYGVPAGALTLDRLDLLTIAPGTLATVDNPADTPLTVTKPPQQYVATVVAAGTAGAVVVPRYIGAPAGDVVSIRWEEEVLTWQPVDPLEVPTSAQGIVGLGPHDAVVWLANHLGQGTATPTQLATPTVQAGTPTASTIPVTVAVSANAVGYRFQLATNAGFTTGLVTSALQTAGSGATSVLYTFTGLSAGVPYYVRVMLTGNGTAYTDSNYSTGVQVTTATTTPAPAAPTNLRSTASTSSSITLAWDAAAGTYTLERAPLVNGTPGAYTGIYTGTTASYVNTGLAYLTNYAYQVKVTVGGVDSPWLVQILGTAASGAYTITPATADYQENANIAETQPTNSVVRRASLAYLEYDVTDETSFDMLASTNGSNRTLSVFLNGTPLQRYVSGQGGGTGTYANIALPGSGTRRLKIVIGQGDRDLEQGEILAPSVVSLTFPGAGSTVLAPKPTKAEVVMGFGDSIMSGAVADLPESEAYVSLLRTSSRGFTASSYGSHTGTFAFGSVTERNKAKAQCNAAWAATGVIKTGDISLGTNDYDFMSGTPSDMAAGIATFLDDISVAHPTSRWWIQTPLTRYDKTAARNGFTLQDFRNALNTILIGREHYVKMMDGPAILTSQSDLGTDLLHPNTSGHAKIAAYKAAQYNDRTFASAPSGPTVTPVAQPVRQPIASGPLVWDTTRGYHTVGLSSNHELQHDPATPEGWNAYAPATARVGAIPNSFIGEWLRMEIATMPKNQTPITVGIGASATTVQAQLAGLYNDGSQYDLQYQGSTQGNNTPVPDPVPAQVVVYGRRSSGTYIQLIRANGDVEDYSVMLTTPFYIIGCPYGNGTGSFGLAKVPPINLISNYLETAFI